MAWYLTQFNLVLWLVVLYNFPKKSCQIRSVIPMPTQQIVIVKFFTKHQESKRRKFTD